MALFFLAVKLISFLSREDPLGDKVVVLLLDSPFELPQAGWTAAPV